jgi:tetratricopeptide (TPR) repeat protein
LREDPQAAELEREVNNLPDDLPWPDPFVQELMTRRVGQATTQTEAERLEKLEQYGAAASAYLQQMESDPSVRAYLGAGLNLARIDQFDRALPLLREAIQKDPDNHKAHFALVKVLVARVEKAEKRVPPSQNVLEWYGEIRDHARRVIELKPDNARAYLFWGMALRALEKPNDAIAAFREGIAANPLDIDLRFALAEIYLERGEMVQAAKTLEDARLIDSRDPRLAHLVHQLNQKKP